MSYFFEKLDEIIIKGADSVSLPDDQFKIVLTWLLSIPLGIGLTHLKNPAVRNFYSLFFGMFFQYVCVKKWLFLTLFNSLLSYAILRIYKRKSAWPTFGVQFAILVGCHFYRYIVDFFGWRLDGTTAVMMMFCKFTYAAFYYSDGRLKEMPSLQEYIGYLYFFPSSTIGPVFSFNDYTDYINLRGKFANIPSTVAKSLKSAFFAFVYLLLFMILDPYMNFRKVVEGSFYNSQYLIVKLPMTYFISAVIACKYFGGWKFAQAGMDASGISYNGIDEKKVPKFDGIVTMNDLFFVEHSIVKKTNYWNTSVQTWLKCVFYEAFSKTYKFSPNNALVLTFIVSGAWHGVHPIYYCTFIHWAVINEVCKMFYKQRERFSKIPVFLRNAFQYYFGFTILNYFTIGMMLLDFNDALKYYKSLWYIGTWGPLLMIALLTLTKPKRTREQRETAKEISPQKKQE